MNTVAILLSAFVLSFVALLAFIGSQRRGLFDRSSRGVRRTCPCAEGKRQS